MKKQLYRKIEKAKMRIQIAFDYNKALILALPEASQKKLNAMRSATTYMYDAMAPKDAKVTYRYVKSAFVYVRYCNIILSFLKNLGGIVA